jgi:cephalosporin-C deacetylase-like acetyl esterase
MLNGQPYDYYNLLNDGELKDYPKQGLDNKSKMYFRGMYLRIIRTLDFLTSQPEWDGKRILVIGESQGGGQALAAAGLDHRVSAIVATVPAMCDWGGFVVGRRDSWPYPYSSSYDKYQILNILPYFDVVHLLKGSKATLVTEIGLIDQSCLSTAVYAAINQAEGTKILYNVPYRAHHLTQEAYKEIWLKNVSKPKDDFISNYLK